MMFLFEKIKRRIIFVNFKKENKIKILKNSLQNIC